MKDGAHTHHSSGGGLGLVVAIGAGALLTRNLAAAISRVLPVLVTGAAVIAGLAIAGWVTRAVILYRYQQQAVRFRGELNPARRDQPPGTRAARELAAARQVTDDQQVLLAENGAWPGLVRHEHLHFHDLAAEQVAAILAARQHSGGEG